MLRFPRLVRDLLGDRSASAAVVTAFSVLSLIGGAGLATDTIQWTLAKRQLQRMADSAALAGAFTKAKGSTAIPAACGNNFVGDSERPAKCAAIVELSRYNLLTLNSTPNPTVGTINGYTNATQVTIDSNTPLPFSSMFMSATPKMQASATAAAVGFGVYCVLSLENTAVNGITFQGSSNVNLGCGAMTNSQGSGTNSSTAAVYAGGSSSITASPISAVVQVATSTNYATGTVLQSYAIPQADPYAALGLPSGYSCSGQLSVGANQNKTVQNNSGGVQCYRGMDLKGNVTFDDGTYVIDGSTGGSLSLGAQAVVNCNACTFILTTSSTDKTTVATIGMNGGATWNVKAPETGTYAGIMIYQDRSAPSGITNNMTGNSSTGMQGSIYTPAQNLQFIGNNSANNKCIQLIARQVSFNGSAQISNVCPTNSASKALAGTQIRLVN